MRSLAPEGTGALLLLEVDGLRGGGAPKKRRASRRRAATPAPPRCCARRDEAERQELWRVRRELSLSLKMITPLKFNHDVVVPKGRIPELFALVDGIKEQYRLRDPVLRPRRRRQHPRQHHGRPGRRRRDRARARRRAASCSTGVVALEGSISGEHGIGFAKAPFLALELSPETIALMKRVKHAFDPDGSSIPARFFRNPPCINPRQFFDPAPRWGQTPIGIAAAETVPES